MRQVSADQKDEHRYDDLLEMPRHVSKNHRPMPLLDRAAQFAPFAALTGYNESIQEAARKPEKKLELSETQMEELNHKIASLMENPTKHPVIAVRYYFREVEKEHAKVVHKDKSNPDIQTKRKKILAMQQEESIRQSAKGKQEIIGYYITERKQLKQIDQERQMLVFMDRSVIAFEDIQSIDSEMFQQR